MENTPAAAAPAVMVDGGAVVDAALAPAEGQADVAVAGAGAGAEAIPVAAHDAAVLPAAAGALRGAPVPTPSPAGATAPSTPSTSAAGRMARLTAPSSSAAIVTKTSNTTSSEPSGPRVFGVALTREQLARASSATYPAFFAVLGEPDVAVLQDPVLGSEVTRTIETVRYSLRFANLFGVVVMNV